MSTDLHTGSGASVTQLVTGIISDAQELMRQQLALFRSEIREDMRKTREATISLIAGAIVLFVGSLLLCFMLVYALAFLFEGLPMWGSFAIVGGVLAIIGGILVWAGIQRFRSFNPLPDESAHELAENVRWIKNPK